MAALRLEGIAKSFGGNQEVVAGVDLEVHEGEMVVLLGPSGCGKSTLLRIIAGIETPTRGRVYLDDRDVTELPPQGRDVAMVFQNYALYPHMNVRENIAFGLKMRGYKREVVAQRVSEVAGGLGLGALLDRRPSQLSGGQRQRVALGRAIARNAKVFLLDEPLSNLDVQLRVNTRAELARLHRGLKVPMVYVTHDQEEAMTLGDRVVVMRAGQILQIGTPMDVYANPRTTFVAGFVGSPRINFLEGAVAPIAGGGARLTAPGAGMELTLADAGVPVEAPRDVLIGIRPEDVEIVPAKDADRVARADVIEPLGREVLLHFILGEARDDGLHEFRVLAASNSATDFQAPVGLRLRRERIHLFDAATEERLGPRPDA